MGKGPKQQKIKTGRKAIKQHVKKSGENTDFHLTGSFCQYWWCRFNNVIFDGMLVQPVRFEFRKFPKADGWCKPYRRTKQRRVTMGINSEIWERKMFYTILIHEMVHQFEWEVARRWETNSHGDNFFVWTNDIKQLGLELKETY